MTGTSSESTMLVSSRGLSAPLGRGEARWTWAPSPPSARSESRPSGETSRWPSVRCVSFFQAEDGIRDYKVTGVQTCAVPICTGVAGWVLVTRQPLVIEELQQDPRFAREVAESTGYVPKGLMAVPLLHEERALGVLEVLDRPQQAAFSLKEMELLGLFASEAAIALDLLQKARLARAVLEDEGTEAT